MNEKKLNYLNLHSKETLTFNNTDELYSTILDYNFEEIYLEGTTRNLCFVNLDEETGVISFQDEEGKLVLAFPDQIKVTSYCMTDPETDVYLKIIYRIVFEDEETYINCFIR